MKEIGGYIELDKSTGREYHKTAIALNSGRHCLEYLIRAKKIKKIYIPYFLCSSVKEQSVKCGCKTEFYHIDKSFRPVFSKILSDDEYLYIVNYYGQLKDEDVKLYKKIYKNIIIDNAQAFFKYPVENVDTLYTCRKFFGVPDGGYLYTDKLLNMPIDTDKSFGRMDHLLGRLENRASEYYDLYKRNEYGFEHRNMAYMSKITQALMNTIEYKRVEKRRIDNYTYLHERLRKINQLELVYPMGAFMYPLLLSNGKLLRARLIKRKIYVPTLWKDVFGVAKQDSVEWNYAENIVPLPVDQRYNIEDMKYIISVLKECI